MFWAFIVVIVEVAIAVVATLIVYTWHERRTKGWDWRVPESDLWRSNFHHFCARVHPSLGTFVLCAFRIIAFSYLFMVEVYKIVTDPLLSFAYFTAWNFLLLILYFAIATYYSLTGVVLVLSHRTRGKEPLVLYIQEPPKPYDDEREYPVVYISRFGRFFLVLYEVCFASAFVVDFLLWCVLLPMALLAKGERERNILDFISYNQHAVNLALIFTEYLLNRLPFKFSHLAFVILWGASYVTFQWAYNALGGRWTYPFMNTNDRFAPLYYFSLVFVAAFFYSLCYALSYVKKRFCRTTADEFASFVGEYGEDYRFPADEPSVHLDNVERDVLAVAAM